MSEIQIDLHSHSTASDGTLSPADLVGRAHLAGVQTLALTDHDTTDGIAEAAAGAARHGMRLIPGVEVSATWNRRTVHIIGLRVDTACRALQDGLKGLRAFRGWRAEEIARRLDQHGIGGAYEGARDLAKGTIVSRTHFAHFLVARGYAKSVRQVFQRFLVNNKPGHVPGKWARLEDAVGWIIAAGGQAVIAHPARYKLTATKLRSLLSEFKASGGVAMEVVSGSHSRMEALSMAAHARTMGLLASAGSDYHGPENPWIELGRLPPFPAGCTPIWSTWDEPEFGTAGNTGTEG